MKDYFGIDFGTTNSAAVIKSINGQISKVNIGDDYGLPFPSFVAIDSITGEIYTGRENFDRIDELQGYCEIIQSVKSYLGTDKTWSVAGKTWYPEDVAAEIFKGLKKKVSAMKSDLSEAVVAVPVGFGPKKRKSLRTAARKAGIEIISYTIEPTSAYVNLSMWREYSRIAVFDWGGGTLDISLLQRNGDYISEIATAGENFAGDDIDMKLARYIYSNKSSGKTPFFELSSRDLTRLKIHAEHLKRELSDHESVKQESITLENFKISNIEITKDTFNDLISIEIKGFVKKLRTLIEKSGWSVKEIDKIILVGGSCKIPLLREQMDNTFGEKCYYPDNVDWYISEGAASLAISPGSYVPSHDFGVVLSDDSFFPLIKEGDNVKDFEKSFNFGLIEDSKGANFIFAEKYPDKYFRRIGKYVTVPTFGFHREPIECTIKMDEDLLISVSMKSGNNNNHIVKEVWEDVVKFKYFLPNQKDDNAE